jgi:hypothetical protein
VAAGARAAVFSSTALFDVASSATQRQRGQQPRHTRMRMQAAADVSRERLAADKYSLLDRAARVLMMAARRKRSSASKRETTVRATRTGLRFVSARNI